MSNDKHGRRFVFTVNTFWRDLKYGEVCDSMKHCLALHACAVFGYALLCLPPLFTCFLKEIAMYQIIKWVSITFVDASLIVAVSSSWMR